MKKTALFIASLFVLSASLNVCAQTNRRLHLLHTYKIGSSGGWDYLLADHASNRLYISHATQVNILNEKTGDSVGVILNTPGVHGIALAPLLKKGYTSNGKTGECTVFNSSTNAILGKIKVGENPDAIFYDDFSKKIFVFNGRSSNASVIDPEKDKIIATIALGGKPETGVSDGKGNIYVNIEDKNEVVCFNVKTFKVTRRYKLQGGEEPSGLAMDRLTSRLFIGCANKVMLVLDANTGKLISTLAIGDGCDGVAFDPELRLAYSANGEGTLTVIKEINAGKFAVAETIKTAYGARTITLDYSNHHVFLPVSDFKPTATPGKHQPLMPGTFRVLEFGK